MTIRRFEQVIVLAVVAIVAALFISNLTQNPQLLDLSVPVMAALIFFIWAVFNHPHK